MQKNDSLVSKLSSRYEGRRKDSMKWIKVGVQLGYVLLYVVGLGLLFVIGKTHDKVFQRIMNFIWNGLLNV